VYPQKQRSWRVGVEETAVDRPAEARNHKSGQHQRHAEIEMPAQERLEQVCCAWFFLNTSSYAATPTLPMATELSRD